MPFLRPPRTRLFVVLTTMAVLCAWAVAPTVGADDALSVVDIDQACDTDTPYFVIASHCAPIHGTVPDGYPSIQLFQDTLRDDPHFMLASMEEVGSIWGLGYARRSGTLYASAFHKRQLPFGPGGPGAIYRIDLTTGGVDTLVVIPDAGEDHHRIARFGLDVDAAAPAGRTSLGDLELSEDETRLFVVNLFDRHIYHLRVADGAILHRFPHGASESSWAEDARPFGLGVRGGYLYHGVVHTAESTQRHGELFAHVYRSREDGTAMTLVAEIPLTQRRGIIRTARLDVPIDWKPWKDGWIPPPSAGFAGPSFNLNPMPLLSDIDFDDQGRMLVAFHDRFGDASTTFATSETSARHLPAVQVGDVLRGEPKGDRWHFDPSWEGFEDEADFSNSGYRERFEETLLGGLAFDPRIGRVGATALRLPHYRSGRGFNAGMALFDAQDGRLAAQESVCTFRWPQAPPERLLPPGLGGDRAFGGKKVYLRSLGAGISTTGDLESTCGEAVVPTPTVTLAPTPTEVPTDAPPTPTRTATTTRTPAPSPTWTPTTESVALYLPVALFDAECQPSRRSADIVLVLDTSTSMSNPTRAGRTKLAAAQEAARAFLDLVGVQDRVAIVSFNATARRWADLGADHAALDRAIDQLAMAELTRIHLGLEEGLSALRDGGLAADRTPVIILLTDGRSNPDPVSEALLVADRARAVGVQLFTIALGDDVDLEALRAMATEPDQAYVAPDGEDLHEIYEQIAASIPCPHTAFWPHAR